MMLLGQVVPMVVDQGGHMERAYDIYSLLLKERIVILGTQVSEDSANLTVAQLLYLDREDPEKPIQMYIQSPGGEVYAGLAIYDAMQQISAPVSTVAVGRTASFGTVILTAGHHGMRYALPSATIHMHQPFGGVQGQVTDMMIHVNEYQRLKDYVNEIFVKHTGRDKADIRRDLERDIYLSPHQAVEYGLIDRVLEKDKVKALAGVNGNGNGKG